MIIHVPTLESLQDFRINKIVNPFKTKKQKIILFLIALMLLPVISLAFATMPEDIWYKINEGTGTAVNDFGTDNNDATLDSATGWAATGGKVYPQRMDFIIGDNQLSSGAYTPDNDMSWCMWFRINNTMAGTGNLLYHYDGGGAPYSIWQMNVQADNSVRIMMYDGGSKEATGSGALTLDTWYHVCGQWDDTGNHIYGYINGTAFTTQYSGAIDILQEATAISIGAKYDDSLEFDGDIQDVRMFDRVLNTTEISWLYNSGSGRDCAFDGNYPNACAGAGWGGTSNSNVSRIFDNSTAHIFLFNSTQNVNFTAYNTTGFIKPDTSFNQTLTLNISDLNISRNFTAGIQTNITFNNSLVWNYTALVYSPYNTTAQNTFYFYSFDAPAYLYLLFSGLSSLNTTMLNINNSLFTEMVNINNSLSGYLASLISQMSAVNTSLYDEMNNINSSIAGYLTSIMANIENMNTTLRDAIISNNETILLINTSLYNYLDNIHSDISGLNNTLFYMNLTLEEINENVGILTALLNGVNNTIYYSISNLTNSFNVFKNNIYCAFNMYNSTEYEVNCLDIFQTAMDYTLNQSLQYKIKKWTLDATASFFNRTFEGIKAQEYNTDCFNSSVYLEDMKLTNNSIINIPFAFIHQSLDEGLCFVNIMLLGIAKVGAAG